MSSDHARLLRRPLPPKSFPPIVKTRPAPRPAVKQPPPLCLSDADGTRSSRQEVDSPAPRAAPPTPLQDDTCTCSPVMDRLTGGFPCKPPRLLPRIPLLHFLHTDPRFIPPPPSFCLNDFLQSRHGVRRGSRSLQGLRTAALSRCNYKKLVSLLLTELHRSRQAEPSRRLLAPEGLPEPRCRIPRRQLLCELAALIHMEVQAQQASRWSCLQAAGPRLELDLWPPAETQQVPHQPDNRCPGSEVILNSVTTRFFQGSRRTRSPFQPLGESISPSELAILDCLSQGGRALSLKTLVYLNLSFNDLSVFPVELYDLSQLEVLKLRDNPLQQLPAGVHRLVRLQTLILSFCRISCLPADLYLLPRLQSLDVSYNLLSSLSNDIRKLSGTLQVLNVEGNQLPALPCGALHLRLKQLRTAHNFMHPYFLESFSRRSAQTLRDLAALVLRRSKPGPPRSTLPPAAQHALCRGPLFGPGLQLIRPCYNIFGRRRVPFMFRSCSPGCLENFQNQTENLTHLLYGEENQTENLTHLLYGEENQTENLTHLLYGEENQTEDLTHLLYGEENQTEDLTHLLYGEENQTENQTHLLYGEENQTEDQTHLLYGEENHSC
ncbi:leucine-rich repeat-containing protein 63 [Centroberyx affinis]|uniref:leucine-rich repeat-containing protein 63 n=1 Tax=Centroberyx affinis TaxID=166261 RepID=UPI003A5C0A97